MIERSAFPRPPGQVLRFEAMGFSLDDLFLVVCGRDDPWLFLSLILLDDWAFACCNLHFARALEKLGTWLRICYETLC